jgi:hypothetical protein
MPQLSSISLAVPCWIWAVVQWLTAETINEEASGYFLVLSKQVPAGWRVLAQGEANSIFGRCWATDFNDDEDENCPTDEDAVCQTP